MRAWFGVVTGLAIPVVFCDVMAVIAVMAYDPSEVTVLISACIPAPPEESEPAIINTLDLGFKLFDRFFYDLNTSVQKLFIF